MTFGEDDLTKYVKRGLVPNEAMMMLNKLLFQELKDYCHECEEDRMLCVLSPACPKRILLKVRIQAGASQLDDLPKFCYSQAVNNIKRYFNKNTTLYTPQDEIIFNEDFIEILFPKMFKRMMELGTKDPSKIHNLISKTKIPAVNLDIRHGDRQIFTKIITKDKVIREGTFIYDLSDDFLIVWFEGIISIVNFVNNVSIVNAKEDIITDLRILDIVFHMYCAELDISGLTTISSENQIELLMRIPFNQVKRLQNENDYKYMHELIEFLQKFFFEVQFSLDAQENFVISVQYQNLEHFLKRNQLTPLTYSQIHQIIQRIDGLRRNE